LHKDKRTASENSRKPSTERGRAKLKHQDQPKEQFSSPWTRLRKSPKEEKLKNTKHTLFLWEPVVSSDTKGTGDVKGQADNGHIRRATTCHQKKVAGVCRVRTGGKGDGFKAPRHRVLSLRGRGVRPISPNAAWLRKKYENVLSAAQVMVKRSIRLQNKNRRIQRRKMFGGEDSRGKRLLPDFLALRRKGAEGGEQQSKPGFS